MKYKKNKDFIDEHRFCFLRHRNLVRNESVEGGVESIKPWRIHHTQTPPHNSAQFNISWWRHQMETFSALLAICTGNSPVPGEFPAQRRVTRSFDVFFDLRPNKRLSKQWWGWWFETLSCSLWRHCNLYVRYGIYQALLCKSFFQFGAQCSYYCGYHGMTIGCTG